MVELHAPSVSHAISNSPFSVNPVPHENSTAECVPFDDSVLLPESKLDRVLHRTEENVH